MLKMSELVKRSGVSKSTILFYIKEGLLPEPQKPKPNLHLYDEKIIEKLNFIQYLQTNFNSSIAELKAAFSHKDFHPNEPYKSLMNILDILMGADFSTPYTKDEICDKLNITPEKLQSYIDDDLLYPRDGVFTQTEYRLLHILTSCDKEEMKLIKKYAILSREMSQLEVKLGLSKTNDSSLKHLFDILLIVKPYIFNMQTLKTYKKDTK